MLGYFKEILLINVQSHPMSLFQFDGLKIHRIRGSVFSNSEGKSVLRKAIEALLTPWGKNKIERRALIRRQGGNKFCRIIALSRDDIYLELYLHLEEKHCYYIMKQGDFEVKKYLSDDYETLLNIAGLHFLKDERYSLNIYVTKEALPLTHFRPRLNYKIIDSARGIKDYDLLMADIDFNLKSIKDELRILGNFKGTHELQLSKMLGMEERLDKRQKEYETVKFYLDTYQAFEESHTSLSDATSMLTKADSMISGDPSPIKNVLKQVQFLHDLSTRISYAIKKQEDLNSMDIPQDVSFMKEPLSLISEYTDFASNLSKAVNYKQELDNTNISPDVSAVKEALDLVRDYHNLLQSTKESIKYREELDKANVRPNPMPIQIISSVLYPMQELLHADLHNKQAYLTKLESETIDVRPVNKVLDILTQVQSLSNLTNTLYNKEQIIHHKEQELRDMEVEIKKMEELLPRCECCGQLLKDCEEEVAVSE